MPPCEPRYRALVCGLLTLLLRAVAQAHAGGSDTGLVNGLMHPAFGLDHLRMISAAAWTAPRIVEAFPDDTRSGYQAERVEGRGRRVGSADGCFPS